MRVRKRWLVGAWLLALAASHLVRLGGPPPPRPEGPDERVVELAVVGPDGSAGESAPTSGETVGVLWRDLAGAPDATPLVVLHGSPGSGAQLLALARELAGERRVLVPDLVGFGRSLARVPDYSLRAQAAYVAELFDAAGVERAHVLGFSLGGGVALELAARAPERVRSLTLLGSIGVVELELLGDQELNHLAHAAQLVLVEAALEAVPHFGLLDRFPLGRGYARGFHDTDQTRLRGILERWSGPTLLVHGEEDSLVPPAAAREHHRIVPQSELVMLPGGHFLPFQEPLLITSHVADFLERADAGTAPLRAGASAERLARAAEPFDPRVAEPLGGFLLALFFVAVVLVSFVSEDLACIGVGVLVGRGSVTLLSGTLACLLGITTGDLLLFLAGRTLGRRAFGRAPWSWILNEGRVARSSRWFEERGPVVIAVSRLLPGTRLPTYFAAGLLRTSFPRFLLWFVLAAALWTPAVVWLSARLGEQLFERLELFRRNLLVGLAATLVLGWAVLHWILPLATRRGRRLAAARLRRVVRWEFWPPWLFYAPVALRIAWWTLRHRGRPLFTAANPGMPHGGLLGESKGRILAGLAAAGEVVPPTELLPAQSDPAERRTRVRRFRERHGLELPLVVKPDVGERGRGVRVCRDEAALSEALESAPRDEALLVQAYVEGLEFGVFYARRPDEPRGRVLSITEKLLPAVVGDGRRTLEELILDDPRASLSAALHLAGHAERLDEVPAAGKRVRLGELGTHCRGATFLDGARLASPALEAEVERVSRALAGFCFGRFDLRAPDEEALMAGRFRVLELNGVSAEMGHVYDPRYSVLDGWRTITAQWRLAFEIGAANALRGARVSRLGELLRLVLGGGPSDPDPWEDVDPLHGPPGAVFDPPARDRERAID